MGVGGGGDLVCVCVFVCVSFLRICALFLVFTGCQHPNVSAWQRYCYAILWSFGI